LDVRRGLKTLSIQSQMFTKWHMGHRTSIRFSALPEEWEKAWELKIEIIIKADKNEMGK
jgi:hypothetical protein